MTTSPVCWDLLARKAQSTVSKRQAEWTQAKQQVQQLQHSLQRMHQMYEEYRQQEQAPQASQWDAQARLNHRQFMVQLLKVQERLERELQLANLAAQQRTHALSQAHAQLNKMNTLQDQQIQRQQAALADREQVRMDDLAMMRFNLRTSH